MRGIAPADVRPSVKMRSSRDRRAMASTCLSYDIVRSRGLRHFAQTASREDLHDNLRRLLARL